MDAPGDHEINQEYLANLEFQANNPLHPMPVDARTLTAEEASYLTLLQEEMALMYVCRQPDCMFFGLNSSWVKKRDSYQFKCPCCGIQFQPWSTLKNQVAAAFVLQIVDPVTGELCRIPTVWPPSEEMNWVNNQIELQARRIVTPADVDAWYRRSSLDLKRLIDEQKIPRGLVQMFPSSEIDHMFTSAWEWQEFKAKGSFWGDKFGDEESAREPFSCWTEVIGLIANTVASSRARLGGC